MVWNTVNDEKDLKYLLKTYNWFHDACLKELKYISGSFVDTKLFMYPINDKRDVSIIFQRQFNDPIVIEVVFEGLIKLNLEPYDEKYADILIGAYFNLVDNVFYWAVDDNFDPTNKDGYNKTWLSCNHLKWRAIDRYIGDDMVYINSDH